MYHLLSDPFVKLVPYNREEKICERYSLEQWHCAVHDIDSDEEWANFLSESLVVKCYVLKLCSSDKSIAFVYTRQEDMQRKKNTKNLRGARYGLVATNRTENKRGANNKAKNKSNKFKILSLRQFEIYDYKH